MNAGRGPACTCMSTIAIQHVNETGMDSTAFNDMHDRDGGDAAVHGLWNGPPGPGLDALNDAAGACSRH